MTKKSTGNTGVDDGGAEDGGPGSGTNPFVADVLKAAPGNSVTSGAENEEGGPGSGTNPFVAEVLKAAAGNRAISAHGLLNVLQGGGIDGVPTMVPRRLQHFVGFAQESAYAGTLRIYTSSALDEGVDVLAAEVLYRNRLEPSREDGLQRDVVVVSDKADCIYWSRRLPRAAREPGGGHGYPFPE